MPTVYSRLTVTVNFAVTQYGHSQLLPPANLCAYQDSAVLVPKPLYATGSSYCNCLISLNIL